MNNATSVEFRISAAVCPLAIEGKARGLDLCRTVRLDTDVAQNQKCR